jgi:predicted permease
MHSLASDYRFAWRRLRATPVFTAFAVATLALGIGVTTGIYSAVRAVMTPPTGLSDVDRLVRVSRSDGGSMPMMALSWPEYQDFVAQQSVFDSLAAWRFDRPSVSAAGRTEPANAEWVSGGYFEALGATAQRGRVLQTGDDVPAAAPVAVISHAAWQRWFDASPGAVGQVIRLNNTPFTIVGVADPEFSGLFNGGLIPAAVWITLSAARSLPGLQASGSFDQVDRGRRWISVTARLGPGRTFEEAHAQVAAIGARLNEAYPEAADSMGSRAGTPGRPWVARRMTDVPKMLGGDRVLGPATTALMTAVVLVLLIACTNLANLMLAKASMRRQEFAVRLSLGASRWRVVREALSEAVLIAAVGGVLGVGIARLLMVVLSRELVITRGVAVQLQPEVDVSVLAVATVATSLAMLIAGLAPALYAARADIRQALATDNAGAVSPAWRGRRYLIAVQVAVSVVLVSIAGLCIAQVSDHQQADTGVDFASLALVDVDFRQPQYDAASVRQLVDAVLRDISRQPGVVAASASSGLPSGIRTPGASIWESGPLQSVEIVAGTAALMETLGVEITRGRGIDTRDVAGSLPVVILGERTAESLFGTTDVLGRTVHVQRRKYVGDAEWPEQILTVVGIAESAGRETSDQRAGTIYAPLPQQYDDRLVFAARSAGDTGALVNTLRRIVQSTAPEAPVTQSLTGSALVAQDTLFFRVVAVIATVLGAMALVVALAGLYGILSFLVAGRTREIGIRIAIGASDRLIRRQILSEGLSPVLMGLAAGLGFGAIIRLGLQPLFQRMVPAMDIVVIGLVPLLFLGAGLVACHWPARRASRVNPITALRHL